MTTHQIKLRESFCDAVKSGEKNFEIRKNDRGYNKGDRITFIPISNDNNWHKIEHPVCKKIYEITYVLSGWGLKPGFVVFGIKEVTHEIQFDSSAISQNACPIKENHRKSQVNEVVGK